MNSRATSHLHSSGSPPYTSTARKALHFLDRYHNVHKKSLPLSLSHPSQPIKLPAIRLITRLFLILHTHISIPFLSPWVFRTQFFIQSQLILLQLTRLQQATNLRQALTLSSRRSSRLLLAVFRKQLRVIACELLQLDQEVAQVELEAVAGVVEGEEALDESLDLLTDYGLARCG